MMKVAIGSDHAGFPLKAEMVIYLQERGVVVEDCGTRDASSVDYPDFGHAVAQAVESGQAELGIVICGSGNGINMAANKHAGIRSALCWIPEIAALARQHNDANVLAMPGRYLTIAEGKAIVDTFLSHEFEGGRHARRVDKISLP
jgi:ribose 5-phosphate isomerase B